MIKKPQTQSLAHTRNANVSSKITPILALTRGLISLRKLSSLVTSAQKSSNEKTCLTLTKECTLGTSHSSVPPASITNVYTTPTAAFSSKLKVTTTGTCASITQL